MPSSKKTYRQVVTEIEIYLDKGEAIVDFYPFPRVDDSLNSVYQQIRNPALLNAEGGI